VQSQGAERERLIGFVRCARRRIIANLALWEAALAGAIALLGPGLFFLLGADLVGWPLLLALALGGAAFAARRLWKRLPDIYRSSQLLDVRLGTADQIATAVYFVDAEAPVAMLQRRESAEIVRHLDPKAIFPLTLPRSLFGMGAALLAVMCAFGLRYWLEKPLNFKQPLPQVILQSLLGPNDSRPEQVKSPKDETTARAGDPQPLGSGGAESGDQLRAAMSPEGSGSEGAGGAETPEPGQASSNDGGEGNRTDDDVDMSSAYQDSMNPNAQDGAGPAPEAAQKGDSSPGHQNQGGPQGKDANGSPAAGRADNSPGTLMDRLKEAVNGLLSRLKQKPPAGGPRQASPPSTQKGEPGENSGDTQAGEKEPEEAGGRQLVRADTLPNDSRTAKNSSGENGERGSEQGDWRVPGQAEGNKQIAESRKLKAMGKLGGLYGQRSELVTGAIMVETQGGRQNLQTQQFDEPGRHQAAGGDVSRDEIPLAYQAYIKEYFSRLRRSSKPNSER
jgi:hypothetical protein